MYQLVCIRLNHGGHTIAVVRERLNQYEIEVVPVKTQEWKLPPPPHLLSELAHQKEVEKYLCGGWLSQMQT